MCYMCVLYVCVIMKTENIQYYSHIQLYSIKLALTPWGTMLYYKTPVTCHSLYVVLIFTNKFKNEFENRKEK